MAENNKLVKTSGRKIRLVYRSPNQAPSSSESAPPDHALYEKYFIAKTVSTMKILNRYEKFLYTYKDCLPFEKRNNVAGTLAEIQAYGYMRCSNGMTLWENWKRYG